eukprot:TRINITY_DN15405_c0_g1_i1.p1 TRINITY_DN15405_c0_g1~~TRINITY_DN15405_c0_g1_i1.p1  ORF type:complete len:200 (-),score=59.56 TRINITY_DN15405_c0_g1_i1:260-808(-)
MPRKLKHHEKKLLKKVDFNHYPHDSNLREVQVMRKYYVQNRDDYHKYNKLVGEVKKLITIVAKLDPSDQFRINLTNQLLEKMYNMGLIPTNKSMAQLDKLTVSAFCRRRLPVVMVRLKYAENLKQAVTLIEQGHIRIGPEVVTDPAFFVTRSFEDFITWVDSSKIKRHVLKFNDQLDDYDLL